MRRLLARPLVSVFQYRLRSNGAQVLCWIFYAPGRRLLSLLRKGSKDVRKARTLPRPKTPVRYESRRNAPRLYVEREMTAGLLGMDRDCRTLGFTDKSLQMIANRPATDSHPAFQPVMVSIGSPSAKLKRFRHFFRNPYPPNAPSEATRRNPRTFRDRLREKRRVARGKPDRVPGTSLE